MAYLNSMYKQYIIQHECTEDVSESDGLVINSGEQEGGGRL